MPTLEATTAARGIVHAVLSDRLATSTKTAETATDALLSSWHATDRSKLPTTPTDVTDAPTDDHLLDLASAGELPSTGWHRFTRSDAGATIVHDRRWFVGQGWEYEGNYLEGSRYRGPRVTYTAIAFVETIVVDGRVVTTRDSELRL